MDLFGKKKQRLIEEQKKQIEDLRVEQHRTEEKARLKLRRAQFRGYAGAQISRLTQDFIAGNTSQDTESRMALAILRNRSRQLVRDNDYAKSVIRNYQNNVIGKGIGFQAPVKLLRGNKLDKKTNDMIEAAWEKWKHKKNCHARGTLFFQDIERAIWEHIPKNGEVFIRKITKSFGEMKTPAALEIMESDMLDETYNLPPSNSGANYVRMGVEKDSFHRPVAYWFFQNHPGDTNFNATSSMSQKRVRIPAEEIIHLNPMEATRGIPFFASTIIRMHHMGGMEESEVVTARAASSLMGFIETEHGEMPYDDEDEWDQQVSEFEPGVFKQLNPGEKVNIPSISRPNGQYEPFMRSQLRGVSAGTGVSYESISRDYSQGSYSSTRQAMIEDRDNYRVWQSWTIRNFHAEVFSWWLDLAVLSGDVKIKGYEMTPDKFKESRWKPRGWSWIDPTKEIIAAKIAIRSGISTLTDVIAEQGGDIEDTLHARHQELSLAAELGIYQDTNPKLVSDSGITQQKPAGSADPSDPSVSSNPPDEGDDPEESDTAVD